METVVMADKGCGYPGHDKEVTILLDRVPRQIQSGGYVVAELKRLLGIDLCRDLDEVVCNEFRPLDDSSKVHIRGGESFVSHVRCGGSS